MYEEKLEFNVLKGRIPDFSSGDIELAYTINGEASSGSFPNKNSGYKAKSVTCENGVEASWVNESWSLAIEDSKDNNKIKCSIDFETLTLADVVTVGDYVSMTPTSTSYEIANELTGCTGESDVCEGVTSQTINPSELNLWRVIKINEDGTIEMVSEYVSSTEVYFYGETGYKKLVGSLNTIASQYANDKYTIATRHMGYNGQTEFITATLSKDTCGESGTKDNSKETIGCGDIGYETDTNLVQAAIGTLEANKVIDTTTNYWLASRNYYYYSPGFQSTESSFVCRIVGDNSDLTNTFLYSILTRFGLNFEKVTEVVSLSYARPVRPIVTLGSEVTGFSGVGTESSPWVLS